MPDPAPTSSPTTDTSISSSLKDVLSQDIESQKVKRQEISGLFSDIDKSRQQEKSDLAALPKGFNLTADEYKMMFQPQPAQFRNPYEGTGALASQLAVLASAFTRRPMTNILNTAAAANNALRQGDLDTAKMKFEEWKANRDLALKILEFQKSTYKQQFDVIKSDHKDERDDARAKLSLLAAQFNDPIMKDMIQMGHMDMAEQHFQQTYGLMVDKFNEQSKKLEQGYDVNATRAGYAKELQEARAKGDTNAMAEIQQKIRDFDYAMNPANATAQDKATNPGGGGSAIAQIHASIVAQMKQDNGGKPLDPGQMIESWKKAETLQKGAISGNEAVKLEDRVQLLGQSLTKIDSVTQTLEDYALSAGIAGRATRTTERLGNIFGSNDTDRVQMMRDIEYLQMEAARLLTDASGRPLNAEAKRVTDIIGGLSMGDTVANTLRSMEELQKVYADERKHTLSQLGGTWSPQPVPGEQPAASPTRAPAPAASAKAQPWLDAKPVQ